MDTYLGQGGYRYRVIADWAKLPAGWSLQDVAAVAVDANDQVYAFTRGEHPVCVFDRDGNLLRTWGEGVFTRAHGLDIGPDGAIYCTDDGDHTVRKCDPSGKVLLTLGIPGRPSTMMGGDPFNRCTHTAISPSGDIYVSDGYGNARVHKYSPGGKLLKSFGAVGSGLGEFNLPHNLVCDAQGTVYVADRENHRVQVFDGEGRYLSHWATLHRPCALCMSRQARDPVFYVGELGPVLDINRNYGNLGPRVSVVNGKGEVLARLGARHAGTTPDAFIAPHGIAVDSRGDLYVGEVSYTYWSPNFPKEPKPDWIRTLRKLVHAPE